MNLGEIAEWGPAEDWSDWAVDERRPERPGRTAGAP
jgi:hypothetical protein